MGRQFSFVLIKTLWNYIDMVVAQHGKCTTKCYFKMVYVMLYEFQHNFKKPLGL